ncbi:hypothetical protein ASF84_17625 [Pseudomonas sp. Leaf127]|uniref:hypothetical protein n=1 Tax=Pseudomonas sp. Leaf127 TaxID=1736267 RepID=UPI0007032139|nr:hypothetical protein [Pseudomonas sp. Leaf127]KQQ53631.1 hypothetical protein ASF84_17625 [Pseudomonas sp. Leaf127]
MNAPEETPEALLARRIAGFDAFRSERLPVLHEFCTSLGFAEPHEVLIRPERFLPLLDDGFRHAHISEQNRAWFITRIGYFIGEYLVCRYQGCWQVDTVPGSPTFARYGVGDFSFAEPQGVMIDPFEIAQGYADSPAPRDLAGWIERGMMEAGVRG